MFTKNKKLQYQNQGILQDYIIILFRHYELPLPGTDGSEFTRPSLSSDQLWGAFVVEYVKKYGGGDDSGVYTVNGRTGNVVLGKEDVDLDQVDNTSDLNKPVSTAVQAVFDSLSFVSKSSDVNKVYGTDDAGNQTTYDIEGLGNVNSDWNVYVETDPAYIKNKPKDLSNFANNGSGEQGSEYAHVNQLPKDLKDLTNLGVSDIPGSKYAHNYELPHVNANRLNFLNDDGSVIDFYESGNDKETNITLTSFTQVQADWNETKESSVTYIKNHPNYIADLDARVLKSAYNISEGFAVVSVNNYGNKELKRIESTTTAKHLSSDYVKQNTWSLNFGEGLDFNLEGGPNSLLRAEISAETLKNTVDGKIDKSLFTPKANNSVVGRAKSEAFDDRLIWSELNVAVGDPVPPEINNDYSYETVLIIGDGLSATPGNGRIGKDVITRFTVSAGPDLQRKSLMDNTISTSSRTAEEGHYPSTTGIVNYLGLHYQNRSMMDDVVGLNPEDGHYPSTMGIKSYVDTQITQSMFYRGDWEWCINTDSYDGDPAPVGAVDGEYVFDIAHSQLFKVNGGVLEIQQYPTVLNGYMWDIYHFVWQSNQSGTLKWSEVENKWNANISNEIGADNTTIEVTGNHKYRVKDNAITSPKILDETITWQKIDPTYRFEIENVQPDYEQENVNASDYIKNKPNLEVKVDKATFDETNGYIVSELTAFPDVDSKTLSVVKTHKSVKDGDTKNYPLDIKIGEGLNLVIVDGAAVPTVEITADGVKQEADELKEDKVDKATFADTNGYIVSELTAVPDLELKTLLITKTHQSVEDPQGIEHYPLTLKVGDGLDYKALVTEEEGPVLTISAETLDSEKVNKSSFKESNGYVVSELIADLVDQTLTVKKTHTSVNEDTEVIYPLHLQAVDGLVLTPDGTIPTEPVIKIGVPSLTEKVEKSKFIPSSGFVVGEMGLTLEDNTLTVKKTHISVDTPTVNVYDLNLKAVDGLKLTGIDPLNIEIGVPDLVNKVDKVEDYGLSKNDFTDDLLTKLTGIEPGAEVNIRSNWLAISGDAMILNKPGLVNDHEYGFMSVADKAKLDTIEAGAELNIQSDYTQSDINALDYIKNKPVIGGGALKINTSSTPQLPPLVPTTIFSANTVDDSLLTLHHVAFTGDYADVLSTPPIINDLTTGGVSNIASAETVKNLKSLLDDAMAQQHLRGAVWNALTSGGTNYGVDTITLNTGGNGYQVGDAVFIPASTSQGTYSIDAIVVITGVNAGVVDTFTVSKVGDYESEGDAVVTAIGGNGSGLTFNVTWATKPASTLADIQLPVANDVAFVLKDEVHNGETWQWAMMDYNGDKIYNWVPITTVDVKARNFVSNPISINELATNAVSTVKILDYSVTNEKIENQSITSAKIEPTLLTSITNVQPDYVQTNTGAADFIKNKPTIGNADLNIITTSTANATYPSATKIFDANTTTAGTLTLHNIARTGNYDALLNKPIINDYTITLQQNGITAGSFTLNQSSEGTVNFTLATASADGIMSKEAMTKLNGIAAGAEVNVQSDWNQATTTADDFIKNKPTIGNATLTVRRVNDSGSTYTNINSFTANATTAVNVDIPLAVGGTTLASGLIKGVDQKKLDTVMTQWYGTAAEYAAIGTKDANTEYNIYE